MDNLVFEESVNAEISDSEFISRKWVYVNDNNSQNYSSQVILDTTPLANAGGYVNWSEGYMIMPLIVTLTTAVGEEANLQAIGDNGDWSWAFKNGFWQMINSMTVEFNNQNIVQQTPFLNVFRSFKNQTSFSTNDVETNGAGIGFAMDSADSWQFTQDDATAPQLSTANFAQGTNYPRASGVGLSNNIDFGIHSSYSPPVAVQAVAAGGGNVNGASRYTQVLLASPVAGQPYNSVTTTGGAASYKGASGSGSISQFTTSNKGMYERQKAINTNNVGATNGATAGSYTGQGLVIPPNTFKTNYISGKLQSANNGIQQWAVYAKLRLKDLSDFFNKCPLLKGSTMRFYINTNQAITTFDVVDGIMVDGAISTLRKVTLTSVSVNGGLTCPLMVTSPAPCSGSSPLLAGTYSLSVSIYKNNFTAQSGFAGIQTTSLTAVRLYAPVYKFNPLAEQRYLSLTPTKKVEYNDVFQYQFSGIEAGGAFNFLVSNGLPNIQSVLVVPFISSKSNGNPALTTNTNTLLSPFTSSGGTPDPIPLSNFNILVSGVNLFLNNEQYDYEAFNQELICSNQLNGNLTTGLTSGLISQEQFTKLYRWYYGNCARVLPSEEGVSRSVQIQGTNTSALIIDMMVFVEFKKSMTIDISTGARIE
jgi:hypothetical protein